MNEIKIYNTLLATVASETNEYNAAAEDYADQLFEALEKDDTNLAPYADSHHGSTYVSKLHRTKITVEWIDGKLYGVCTALVDDDWTDDDTAQLKSFLIGQYADGYVHFTKMFSSIGKRLKIGDFTNRTEHNYYSEFSISIRELSSFQSFATCGFNSG